MLITVEITDDIISRLYSSVWVQIKTTYHIGAGIKSLHSIIVNKFDTYGTLVLFITARNVVREGKVFSRVCLYSVHWGLHVTPVYLFKVFHLEPTRPQPPSNYSNLFTWEPFFGLVPLLWICSNMFT